MAARIVVTRISQAQPIASPAAVTIEFNVLGTLPDVVQVSVGGRDGGIATLMDQVKMSPPKTNYTSLLKLPGGTAFLIDLCPRTVTNGVLDDLIDGQAFETFCTAVPFTTQAPAGPGPRPKPPTPRLDPLEPHQATLHGEGSIRAHWTAVVNFDQYHVIVQENQGPIQEFELDNGGQAGAFEFGPAFPGRQYSFKVQGCITHLIGLNDCSEFTPPLAMVMPPNSGSLRTFLRLSNVAPGAGLRSLGAAVSRGVRAMMRL